MGGRGGSSGISNYTVYNSKEDSIEGLGLGNGGETDRWMNSLTDDENQAVRDYTGDAYEELNAALREGRDFDDDDDYYNYSKIDTDLESALNKFNLDKGVVFQRGSSAGLLGGANTVEEINAMKGSIVHDKGYTSTAAHSGGGFSGEIIYHISTPGGKGIGAYVRGISHFSGENEFLFNKGSAFKVIKAYEKGYDVHCDLLYVGRF